MDKNLTSSGLLTYSVLWRLEYGNVPNYQRKCNIGFMKGFETFQNSTHKEEPDRNK